MQEFRNLAKSIKTIIVIGIIFGITYFTANSFDKRLPEELSDAGDESYSLGVILTILVLGLMFITILSHDTVNREINDRTVRFLVPRISRSKIILGKFIGIFLFWALCIVICFGLLIPFIGTFYWPGFLECILFIAFGISLYLFLSTIISKPSISLFIGILLSLAFPIMSFWALLSQKPLLTVIRFLTPYYYLSLGKGYLLIVILMTIALIGSSILVFERKDL